MLKILSFLVTCCLLITFKSLLAAAEPDQGIISGQHESETGGIAIDNTPLDAGKLSDTNTLKQDDHQTSESGPVDESVRITPEPEVDIKVHSSAAGAATVAEMSQEEGLTPLKSSADLTSESTTSSDNVDPASQVLKTQDLEPLQVQDKQDATTDSARQADTAAEVTVGEVSTVQGHVLPTTPDSMGHMSSLVDTPTLDDLHARILDSVPLSPHQPSLYLEPMTYDHLQATESLKTIIPGTWDGMSRYSAGIGGSVLDEDSKARSGDGDFPTFDKWSVQYLAEQEKQKTEKDKENTGVQSLPAGLAAKKLRHNFAAASCGAKVIAGNPEAENNNHLLNGNPDEYMLNPCKAKKWFVVELCEPLQIHRVEIGTVELFASQPKSFRVFASSRYPTKEWTTLGKYEMSPVRVVQSFATTLSEEFVKYVKVEMLEHHGDEHYCPLTAFKVLGIDMSEEDFENENEVIEVEGQEAASDLEDDSVEGSVNLFTSAKETVVKLVQKVWYKGDQEGDGAAGKGEKHLGEGEIPAENGTVQAEEQKGESLPCSQKDSGSLPTVSIPPVGVVVPASVDREVEEVPIVTKLTDSEQVPTDKGEAPVVIKLGRADPDLPDSVCPHSFWSSYVHVMMPMSQSATCGMSQQEGLKPLGPKSAVSEIAQADQSRDGLQPVTTQVNIPTDTVRESVMVSLEVDLKISDTPVSVSSEQAGGSESAADNAIASVSSSITVLAESSPPAVLEASSVTPVPDHLHHHAPEESVVKAAQEVVSSQSSSFTSAGVSVTKSEQLEPSSVSSYRELENEAVSSITPGLHIQKSQVVEQGASDLAESMFLKVSPSPTLNAEDSQEGQAEMPTSIERQEVLGTPQLKEPGTPSPPSESNATEEVIIMEQSKTQGDSVSNGSQAVKAGKTIDLVKVGMTSVGKRDNSIMKLNNRIIALEQNVSMTKKYLEELSRVFKQQNEEMMKLLNKTEKRVTVFVAQSEDKDVRQQDHIDVLEQKVVNLTQTVEDLQLRLETLDKQVSDGHCLLLFFQAGLFLWMLVSTIRGRSKQSLAYSDHQFLLDTMPKQPSMMESGVRQRRNSDKGPGQVTGASMSMTALKRQKSETNIAAAGKTDETVDRPYQQDGPPVAKRKKKKKYKLFAEGESSLSEELTAPLQTSSFSSSAGVLFGTNIISAKGSTALAKSSTQCDSKVDNLPCLLPTRPKRDTGCLFKTDKGGEDQTLTEKSFFIDQWRAFPASSHDDISSASGARPRGQGSPISAHRKSFSGGASVEKESAKSPEFTLPSYHKSKIHRPSDGGCDKCGLRTKPYLKNTRGKHSSWEETRQSMDFLNPKFGHEFFLAENYLQENRFRFLSSPNKDALDRLSTCAACSDEKAAMVCPMCFDSSTTLYSVSPGSSDMSRVAVCPHYPSARVDVQPLPAVILCPATLAQAVVSGAASGLSRQSSFSSSTSSASSAPFGPQAKVAGSPRPDHDHSTAHPSTPHHLPPPPRPPPPALSTLSLTKMKETARRDTPADTSSDKSDSADQSSVHATGHMANGTSRKLPSTHHPQKSKKSIGSLQHGASKSIEKEPPQKQENPKILVKSSSISLPHDPKPSAASQHKKSAISKLTHPFRKS